MQGTVVKFDTARGFGFIRVPGRADDLFVHISNVRGRNELRVGQRVSFDLGRNARGPQALNVVPGRVQRSPYAIFNGLAFLLTVGLFLGVLVLFDLWWPMAYLTAINLCTVLLYGYDKAVAGSGLLRVPERTLQWLAIFFGSPGAWMSQELFRHKTHKEPFRTRFRLIIAVQLLAIIGLFWWNSV